MCGKKMRRTPAKSKVLRKYFLDTVLFVEFECEIKKPFWLDQRMRLNLL